MTTTSLPKLTFSDKIAALEIPDVVTVDTEGDMLGFSFCFDGMFEGFYLPFTHAGGNMSEKEQKHALQVLGKKDALVFHNAIHDLKILRHAGLDYQGEFYDTMLMAHWINEELMNYKLDYVSRHYGGRPKEMPEQMSMIIDSDGWEAVPVAWMDEYSGNDAYITHQAFRTMEPIFWDQFSKELWATEQEFLRRVMGPMIERGIKIDSGFCMIEWLKGTEIMQECVKELGFKPTPSTLEKFLIQELGLPVVKHTKSCIKCFPEDKRLSPQPVSTHKWKPSFDKDAMEEYDAILEKNENDKAKTILRYRGWQKTTTSNYKPYLELVDDHGILHPGFKLHGTRTGRLSCAEPNLQQIPKSSSKEWNGHLKNAFIPRPTFRLWTVDYSQLQFRMTCAYAVAQALADGKEWNEIEVAKLVEIFNDFDRDIFTEMASQMAWLRDDVKTLVYLILFGGGAYRASVAFGVSVESGGQLVQEFHALYPEIKTVSQKAQRAATRLRHVTYWTGRRRHFPRGSKTHKAFNAVIQGGEAEIIKRAMIRIAKEICDENCWMVLQIHDEIAFEIKEGMEDDYLPRIQQVMSEAAAEFCKVVGVDIKFKTSAKPWGEK